MTLGNANGASWHRYHSGTWVTFGSNNDLSPIRREANNNFWLEPCNFKISESGSLQIPAKIDLAWLHILGYICY